MKTALILQTIDALTKAQKAFWTSGTPIGEQVSIGSECAECALKLRKALLEAFPEVPVERGAASTPEGFRDVLDEGGRYVGCIAIDKVSPPAVCSEKG